MHFQMLSRILTVWNSLSKHTAEAKTKLFEEPPSIFYCYLICSCAL